MTQLLVLNLVRLVVFCVMVGWDLVLFAADICTEVVKRAGFGS